MNPQKITQEILDKNEPKKPNYFFLRKLVAYFIMFLLVGGIGATFITFLLNSSLGTMYSQPHFFASWILSAIICLAFLAENVLSLPVFVRTICGLKEYGEELKKHIELEEEFEKQQEYLKLKAEYKDLV